MTHPVLFLYIKQALSEVEKTARGELNSDVLRPSVFISVKTQRAHVGNASLRRKQQSGAHCLRERDTLPAQPARLLSFALRTANLGHKKHGKTVDFMLFGIF
ncbi:MAG: hypothetical protein IJV06_11505 [Bacteroidaceae bacterium]|nr:hypothetical protein [Bacteroidaceae bacterium]